MIRRGKKTNLQKYPLRKPQNLFCGREAITPSPAHMEWGG